MRSGASKQKNIIPIMTQTQKKSPTTLHLRITKDQWLKDFRSLTRAQLGVLYYISTSDPFGDRGIEITLTDMAEELGLNKSSVSRALKQLEQMGHIDLELIKTRIKVLHTRDNVAFMPQVSSPDNVVVSTPQASPPDNNVASMPQASPPRYKLPSLPREFLPGHEPCIYATSDASTQQALHPHNEHCADATSDASTQQALHPRNKHCADATSDASTQRALHPRNERCTHATSVAPTQQALHPRNNQPPEPLQNKGSEPLQTNKTNKTNKTNHTLSNTRERDLKNEEKNEPKEQLWAGRNFSPGFQRALANLPNAKAFIDWAYEHCGDGLPSYPTYPSSVIEKNYFDLWQRFCRTQGQPTAPSQDWANHPLKDKWLAEMRLGIPRFVAMGGPDEEQPIRRKFADWARANNLIWGNKS
jgi:hypothetical protein